MDPKKKQYENQAKQIIKAFNKRQIEGHFCPDSKAALAKVNELIEDNSSVSWGGSMTLGEIGVYEALYRRDKLSIFDRGVSDPEQRLEAEQKGHFADYYLMSTNALTLDGKLVNIDGNGNRLSALIHGPKNIIVVTGMNKVCSDEEAAMDRIHALAAPANALRLSRNTPCAESGSCADCQSPDSICSHIVITRRSHMKNRIKVILIPEELGY